MSKIKYNISLDMHSLVSQASLAAKQGDDNRQFAITLRSGGQPYKIERGAFAVFSTTLPDGKVIEDNCIIANNEIVYDFTQNLTSQVGVLNIEIRLYDANSKLITSPTFILVVSPRAAKAEDITSSNSFTALDNLYKDTSEAIQRADDAANFANSTARSIEEARDNGDFNGDVNYNLVSNALKGRASGAAVTLTDISPLEHILGVKARSKNILNENEPTVVETTSKGEGWKQENGTWVGFNAYYLTLVFGSYHLTKGQTVTISFECENIGGGGRALFGSRSGTADLLSKVAKVGKNAFTYTATDNIDIYITFTDYGATGNYIIKNIMLCYGTDSEYAPHIADISTAKVQRYGKSLFDFEYKVFQASIHRIDSKNMLIPIQNQVFAFSIDKTPSEFGLHIEYADGSVKDLNLGYGVVKYFFKFDGEVIRLGSNSSCAATKNLDGKVKRFGFWVYGQDSAGWDTEPLAQVELNTEATEYEPYTEPTTHDINADGTVEGVTSLYPTTTLTSDTEGVILDVEYNRDINILTKTVPLLDRETGIPYYLYVAGGKLLIEEREV